MKLKILTIAIMGFVYSSISFAENIKPFDSSQAPISVDCQIFPTKVLLKNKDLPQGMKLAMLKLVHKSTTPEQIEKLHWMVKSCDSQTNSVILIPAVINKSADNQVSLFKPVTLQFDSNSTWQVVEKIKD